VRSGERSGRLQLVRGDGHAALPVIRWLAVALLFAATGHVSAACVETLVPAFVRDLTAAKDFTYANDLAWLPNGKLLIGGRDGVTEYSLADETSRRVVSGDAVPDGLPMVQALDTDGATLVAFNSDYGDMAFDVAKKRVLRARRRPAFQMFDLAVRGRTVAVLGRPLLVKGAGYGALWIGEVGAPWETFRLLRESDRTSEELLRNTLPPYGGGIVFTSDGTLAMITASEVGVARYRPDGTALPSLGTELDALVIRGLPEIAKRYRTDFRGRYEGVLNRQPLADDLIETNDGLAIVVRQWATGVVTWELWFPDAKTTRRRVRLASDRRPTGGHMRCDAQGGKVACLFDRYVAANQSNRPHLAVYDLAQAKRDPKCR